MFKPDFAALGELDGVVDEVGQDLTEAQRVAEQLLGNRGSDMDQELEPFLVRLLGRERGDRADHLVELEIGGLDVELAGLDLGEIEDVIDDAEQRRAGVVDLADVVALLGIKRRLEGEVRETDDGVHGRADLVAHVGQEHALLPWWRRSAFCMARRSSVSSSLNVGDVLSHAVHVGRFSVGILHHMPQGMDPDHAPIDRSLVGDRSRHTPGSCRRGRRQSSPP